MNKKLFISAIIFCFIFIIATISYFCGYWRFNYPGKDTYPIRGLDVSHHQGRIDWNLVKEEGFNFVFIKATEGGNFKDPEFKRNWKEASRIGLLKSAYHFFSFCKPGIEQAHNFINTVPLETNTLPPVIDFEFVGNCSKRLQKAVVIKELFNFIKDIEEKYGKSPIIYITYDSYKQYLEGEIDKYHIWIRDIFLKPKLSDSKTWTFWQYADRGRVRGIKGPVDLNVFAQKNISQLKNI
jgi:lysozyme